MEYGIIVYTVTIILAVILAIAGIYFLIYQRHINKALKDLEGAKNSRIKLPSLGISYTGMWFVVWIVSVVITLMMIMDVLSVTRMTSIYAESNAQMLNNIEEQLSENKENINNIHNEMLNGRYVSENNTEFALGNFDPETNTIELKATVTNINMAEGDALKWRMNGQTVDMKRNLEKKTFEGSVKIDIIYFDVNCTLDSMFISEVDGIKMIDRIFKYNSYYTDEYFGIDDSNNVPSEYNYLPEGDFAEYWRNYFINFGARMMYKEDDGNKEKTYSIQLNDGKLSIEGTAECGFEEALEVKDRKAVSAKIVLEIDGKKISEQKIDMTKDNGNSSSIETIISMTANNVKENSKIDFYIEATDNYGYVYKQSVDTIDEHQGFVTDKFVLQDKNGKVIYSEKEE